QARERAVDPAPRPRPAARRRGRSRRRALRHDQQPRRPRHSARGRRPDPARPAVSDARRARRLADGHCPGGNGGPRGAHGRGPLRVHPILPMMQVDAGLSLADGAWLASANYLGTLLGAVAAMVLRVPIPPAVRAGLVTIGLATLAMGVERRVPAWIVLRFVAGLATGWVLPFASGWALE